MAIVIKADDNSTETYENVHTVDYYLLKKNTHPVRRNK